MQLFRGESVTFTVIYHHRERGKNDVFFRCRGMSFADGGKKLGLIVVVVAEPQKRGAQIGIAGGHNSPPIAVLALF